MKGVSDEDLRTMARQATALQSLECSESGDDTQRAEAIDAANGDRRRAGRDELKTEGEFHRKAVALGLVCR